jgi:DNA-binding MarR family transcriptional regulator
MTDALPAALATRLGYLLKHVQQDLMRAAGPVLAEFGIDGREAAVLAVLAAGPPLSQQEAAGRLGVDRTTMVALIDELEAKGLVDRQRSGADRRVNLIVLTDAGQRCARDAGRARDDIERAFLAPLGEDRSREFVRALQILVAAGRS